MCLAEKCIACEIRKIIADTKYWESEDTRGSQKYKDLNKRFAIIKFSKIELLLMYSDLLVKEREILSNFFQELNDLKIEQDITKRFLEKKIDEEKSKT